LPRQAVTKTMTPIRNYSDYISHVLVGGRLRKKARDLAVMMLSLGRSVSRRSGWIRFPYYHHVFDDERRGFSRQLNYLRQFGEFLSLDDSVTMLTSGDPIDGNYFCITFDDGFKNNATNAVPILVDFGASAAFFLVTDLIGSDVEKDRERLLGFYDHGKVLMEFLDWEDCCQMAAAGMIIGSHTVNHARLSRLDEADVLEEMIKSKLTVENNLGQSCEHFCAPFGISGDDFDPLRDPKLARQVGFRSLLTTNRGANRKGSSPYMINRDHMLAGWGNYQLRYFLSAD